jgi:hypothetical protein
MKKVVDLSGKSDLVVVDVADLESGFHFYFNYTKTRARLLSNCKGQIANESWDFGLQNYTGQEASKPV